MTPDEALKLLDSVVAQITLKREDHQKLGEALAVINNALQPKPDAPAGIVKKVKES